MENKYYTPELEEFHPGFRVSTNMVESLEIDYKTFVEWGRHNTFYIGVQDGYIRVKYLDRSDIEELGWEYKGDHWFYKGNVCYRIEKEMEYYWLHTSPDDPTTVSILIGDEDGYTLEGGPYLFDGQIKNYNELKTLMKWLNIK